MGICCNSYCAYSDTDVRVNYFELHINCQLFKRSDINIVTSRKRYIPSKGKSNTRVISSLLSSIFFMMTEIFHNIILHTHVLLHLYLIPFFLYHLSLIITKSRFDKDKVSRLSGRVYPKQLTVLGVHLKYPMSSSSTFVKHSPLPSSFLIFLTLSFLNLNFVIMSDR